MDYFNKHLYIFWLLFDSLNPVFVNPAQTFQCALVSHLALLLSLCRKPTNP